MNPHRIRQQFHRIAKSRLALSTVVTSLIIVVISVLLAGTVTYFAINVTSTRVQEESLALAKQHVWFDYVTGKAQAAIMVINAGGRDIVIDKLTVRGQACAWSKVFYTTTSDSISGDLFSNSTLLDGGSISVGGKDRVFKQATNDLTLQSGRTLIVYLDNPDSISVNDVGLTVSVNIFTSQAMYYKETNVQGTSGTTTTSSSGLEILYGTAWQNVGALGALTFVVTNTGSSAVSFDRTDGVVNGEVWSNTTYLTLLAYTGVNKATVNNDLPWIGLLDIEDNKLQVQGYTLVDRGSSTLTIQPGVTAIVYFTEVVTSTSGVWDDPGLLNRKDPVSFGIRLDSGEFILTSGEVN